MQNTTTYPKKYMSIKELLPYGFTRCELNEYIKMKGFPAYNGA